MSDIISLEEWRKKQAKTSTSESQSSQSLTWELLGVTPTDSKDLGSNEIEHLVAFYIVLDKAWRNPFKLKSNFAREAALYVATSASLGFISNQIEIDTFCNKWAITPMGIDFKGELDEILDGIAGGIDPDFTH